VTSPSGTAQAQCDDGLGLPTSQASATGTPVYNTATPPQVVYVGCNPSVTDTRYTTNGGQLISLPAVNASASASVSPYEQASASVSYAVTAYPVTLYLGGATEDTNGNYSILVGQGCSAGLSGIPSALLNNAANPPTYKWSIKGTTFQGWAVSSDQKTATLSPGPGPLTNPGASWYWNDPANTAETVTCAVTLTPPNGQGSPFTLTLTKNVSVMLPTYSCKNFEGKVTVTQNGQEIQATPTASAYAHGETWFGNVQTPSQFGGGGYWNYSQIITPNRTHNYGFDVPCTENGKTGLDTISPYPAESGDGFNAGPDANTKIGWLADNSQHRDGDSPSTFTYDSYPSNYGIASKVSIANEKFSTYLMYVPPGGNVQPVPLHKIDWNWSATVTQPPSGWASLYGTSLGSVTSTSSAANNIHPTWAQLEGVSVGRYW
jgi:hypothetical protein